MNTLALQFRSQGKYDEAELIYRQTLLLLEKALGEVHPFMSTSMPTVALLSSSQSMHDEAKLILIYRQMLLLSKIKPLVRSTLIHWRACST